MKKHIIYFSVFICIILLSIFIKWYFTPISLYNVTTKQLEIATIRNVSVNIYFSAHLIKPYEIKEKSVIENLSNIFDDIKVRRTLFPPDTFKPLFFDTYYLIISNNENSVGINFLDKNYLAVGKSIYKIVNKPDLKQIYDITTSVKQP